MKKLNKSGLYNTRCPTCGQSIVPPKSTGWRSQNSKIRGDCQAISEQIEGAWSADMVYHLMKRLAVSQGVYPGIKFITPGITLIEPISMSDANMKEAHGLIDTIQKFADENNFWLWKYTEDGKYVYKSIGGRIPHEMRNVFPDFNICMKQV